MNWIWMPAGSRLAKGGLTCLLLLAATVAVGARPAPVDFSPEEITLCTADATDREALRRTIVDYWQSYEKQDSKGCVQALLPDVTRFSKRATHWQQGSAQVAKDLPSEWSAFERHQGSLSETVTIREAALRVAPGPSPQTAYVTYWVETEGGGHWDFSDQGFVWEALVRRDGKWRVAHHSESWSLDYDLDEDEPGDGTFEFDYVYPVKDLSRAVDFYKPVLGAPEYVSGQRASFNLGGPRFILQVNPLDGLAQGRKGFPCGYAVFKVADLKAVQKRLLAAGAKFFLGTAQQFRLQGADPYVVVGDPSGNLVVLMQPNFRSSGQGPKPTVTGFDSRDPYAQAAGRVARAWMAASPAALRSVARKDCRWFDDTRTRVEGQQQGLDDTIEALRDVYWASYDRSSAGLQARLEVSSLQVRPQADGAIVSYQATLIGTGPHPFRETSMVTQWFDRNFQLVENCTVGNSNTGGMAKELDYTGYPVIDLGRSKQFYSDVLQLGQPYKDTDYLGWWSNFAVFGIYKASLEDDGLPRSGRSNGYVSFWVASARQAYNYTRKRGSEFPVIEAINDNAGISAEPGYNQLLTTDSEGNGVLFTEYTGRMR